MCGIVGYISKKDKAYKDEKYHFMRFALALDTLRGFDSTGLYTCKKRGGPPNVLKSLLPGDQFVQSRRYRDKWEPGYAQVGHNRAATAGKVNITNAHPFVDGPITLVHNGTLWSEGSSLPKYNEALAVDSMQIAHSLSHHAPEEAKDVLEKIDGSFALVWYDERDKSINMARNNERPLHYCVNPAKDIMWFMSDGNHLAAVMRAFKNRSSAHAHSVYNLTSQKHVKFKQGNMVPEVTHFAPFVIFNRSRTKTTTRPTTGEGSPLNEATKKWQEQVENTTKSQSGSGPKNENVGYPPQLVGGKQRKIPEASIKTLVAEYDLTPFDMLRFRPEERYKMGPQKYLVVGTVYHAAWGDCEWRCVLRDVAEVQAKAYMPSANDNTKRDWLIRPVGVTHPWDSREQRRDSADRCIPALLGHLVHCDWAGFAKRQKEQKEEKEEAQKAQQEQQTLDDNTNITSMIIGPENVLTTYSRIKEAVERGCIQCGYELWTEELPQCIWVNDRQDLLCAGCQKDARKLDDKIPH